MEEATNKNLHLNLSAPQRRLFNVLIEPNNWLIPITKRCKKAQINRTTYYDLMVNKDFLAALREFARNIVEPSEPALMKVAREKAAKGDFKFWRALMEMQGKLGGEGISIIAEVVEKDRKKYK